MKKKLTLYIIALMALLSTGAYAQDYYVFTTNEGIVQIAGDRTDSVKIEGDNLNFYSSNAIATSKLLENVKKIKFNVSTPYPDGIPHEPGRVEAEDFDMGGEGIAFHDNDVENHGTPLYRNSDEDNPVDVQDVAGNSNGHGIGWAGNGEWLNYSINVSEAGLYKFTFRTANDHNTSFDLKIDDLTAETVTVPTDWWGGSSTDVPDVELSAGVHVITIYFNGGFAFDYFEFIKQ